MRCRSGAHRRRGFTLIELLSTLAVAGALAGMAFSYGQGGARTTQLRQIALAIVTATNAARGASIRTGGTALVSLNNAQVLASAQLVTGGIPQYTVLSRYPTAAGTQYPSTYTVTSSDLNEAGQAGLTAAFDGRGCFVDQRDSVPRHEANICVTDQQTKASINISLNRLGVARITGNTCAPQPGCPGAQPLYWIP